ncbi:hypothetical protein RN001_010486 [Aquatica leii]|uniref:Uncharacterized protein n=1 Tax=Aquatica leii TaxID=1421715 RepID=A0AAN7SQC4_9COLE|nr:hypothetical protein RN001_010486 [Aquatica leii]
MLFTLTISKLIMQSIAAIYYAFPTLPQHHVSSLENIFTALLFKSSDKSYGNEEASLHLLIKEIKFLENNGITIKHKQIHFILVGILGDNLGLNSILGYTKSFSANFPCRICKTELAEIGSQCEESVSNLRTESNYANDLLTEPASSKRIKLSGIKESSIFNTINFFHVANNYTADIMHDLFDGVCHYDVTQILKQLIEVDKLFSLETLNSRKQLFNYGKTEIGNISPPIKSNHLQGSKLHMSAREMWTFCHFLPLIIGDLVPCNNKYWKLLCLLIEMMDLILRAEFDDNDIQLLTSKIKHHNQYKSLFGNTLKPKFHFLLHYPRIIKKMGPLKHIWCFRFEAKHKELKICSNNTNSRRNIPYTIGIKCALKFSFRIIKNVGLKKTIDCCKKSNSTQNLSEKSYYLNLNFSAVEPIGHTSNLMFVKYISFKGTKYEIGYYLQSKDCLYKIEDMFVRNEDLYFVCLKYKLGKFSNHFQSYQVLESTKCYFVFSHSYFNYYAPIHVYNSSNRNKYIRPKYF